MFQSLVEKMSNAFSKFRNKGKLTEADVKAGMREIKLALLEADVNFKVVKEFVARVSERAVGDEVLESLLPAQHIVKIVNEELVELMGGTNQKINIAPKPPTVILMCGLQGSGKTTHCGKLARMFKKQGRNPLLVACDIYRPAAITQLQVVGGQVGVEVFERGTNDPAETSKEAIKHAIKYGFDTVIIDTAGRLHVDEELMNELKRVKEVTEPTEILLVVDAMTGQDAVNVAKSFNDLLDITGVILTKMDGDTRGGAALSVKYITGKPIKFIGTGEKLDCLEAFHPERMASRILGMGDVLTLIEKAEQQIDEKKAIEMERKFREQSFTLTDFLDQLATIKDMGSMDSLLGMMPGVKPSALNNANIDEKALAHTEAIILSMTPYERDHPDVLNSSRKRRIAAGSGRTVEEVNRLLKQYEQTKQLMKQFMGKKGKRGKFKFPF
ncbi:MAG: signal recognition particle protein [Clostridia bacterium]|nr:signal recognition particle protein [Clostridia bacterium]